MTYSRIESMGRSSSINDGVAAPTADPLWMLGRQWQVGELTGDDAAQPAAVRVQLRHAPLDSLRREGGVDGAQIGGTEPMPDARPLEAEVERAPLPTDGAAALFLAAEMGERLRRRLLATRGLDGEAAMAGLRRVLPLPTETEVTLLPADEAAARLLRRRGVDGAQLASADRDRVEQWCAEAAPGSATELLDAVLAWRDHEEQLGFAPPMDDDGDLAEPASVGTWRPHRFEHRFSVEAATARGRVQLVAPEFTAGRLDWHSFDVSTETGHTTVLGRGAEARASSTVTTPSPMQFAGMPASRWWEFEDGEVVLGDLDAGPGDLARLAVAEFATVYNDDWFLVPVKMRRGELVRVASLEVYDNFGGTNFDGKAQHIRSSTKVDAELLGASGGGNTDDPPVRPWRFFELHGDPHLEEGRSPWLLVPPSLGSTLHGPDLERVIFGRDEDANLAWAIERLIEGPLGRSVDRARVAQRLRSAEGAGAGVDDGPDDQRRARRYGDEYWKWDLESSPPPWWVPLVPDRDDPNSEQVVLRRGRMATWGEHDRAEVGAKGMLLEPHRPFFVREEEVPRSGATVRRTWQWARWEDGSWHLWQQRSKSNGRGERSSGLEWDRLMPEQEPTDTPSA